MVYIPESTQGSQETTQKSWWDRMLEASRKKAMEDKDKPGLEYFKESGKLIGKAVVSPVIRAGTYGQNILATGESLLGKEEESMKRKEKAKQEEEEAFNLFGFSKGEAETAKLGTDIGTSFLGGAGIAKGVTTLAPKTAPLFTAPQTIAGGVAKGAATGMAGEVPFRIATEGRLPTLKEVGTSAIVGGTVGGVLGTLPMVKKLGEAVSGGATQAGKQGKSQIIGGLTAGVKNIERELKTIKMPGKQAVTRNLPAWTVENNLGLTPTERGKIETITGDKPANFVLSKNIATSEKDQLANSLQKIADDSYNGITKELKILGDKGATKSGNAKKMIDTMLDEMESSNIIKRDRADYIEELKKWRDKETYTLSELNALRRDFDRIVGRKIFNAQGRVGDEEDKIIASWRESVSRQIQDGAKKFGIDVKKMNTDLRASIIMRDGVLRRLSQENKNNYFGLQDIGVGAILSAGNPIQAMAVVFGKKALEKGAPSIAQRLYNLNKETNVPTTNLRRGVTVSPRDTTDGLSITPSIRVPKPDEIKLLGSGKGSKEGVYSPIEGQASLEEIIDISKRELKKAIIRKPKSDEIKE